MSWKSRLEFSSSSRKNSGGKKYIYLFIKYSNRSNNTFMHMNPNSLSLSSLWREKNSFKSFIHSYITRHHLSASLLMSCQKKNVSASTRENVPSSQKTDFIHFFVKKKNKLDFHFSVRLNVWPLAEIFFVSQNKAL